MSTIAERVAAGCAWLDEHDPGWWREDAKGPGPAGGPINLDELSMRNPCRCVLGQRYGNYYYAPIQLDESVAHGFDTSVFVDSRESTNVAEAEFAALTVEWSRVIAERRTAAGVDPAPRWHADSHLPVPTVPDYDEEPSTGPAACCPCQGAVCDPGCPCTSGECPKTEAEVTDE